jgi:Cu(I)/Ag(I) efflux system protein CusF
MKSIVASLGALSLSLVITAVFPAESEGMKGMDMKDKDMNGMDMKGMESGSKAKAKVHKGAGSVTKVDPANGKVTIAHGAVKTMNWAPMTMTFDVKDKTLLNNVEPGAKVEFSFVQSGKDYVITKIKKKAQK